MGVLAEAFGRKVLFSDLDPQRSLRREVERRFDMTRKPVRLSDATAKKATPRPPPEPSPDGQIKILTLRLPLIVHEQLREMAFTERRSQQGLALEALNLLFERHGRPPIAT